jgi:steroid delta-isomerase-like uncharacterized protein
MTNVANWDDPPATFELHGPFAAGSAGITRAPGQEPRPWRLAAVNPLTSYVVEAELDRAVVSFEWRFDPLASGTRLTQQIVLRGENAAAYVSQVQTAFATNLAAGMSRIVSAIERADPRQTLQAFLDAINAQDWIRLGSLVAADFVRHSVAAGDPGVRSRADLVAFLRREFEVFPDARETILDMFAEDEKVAVRHHFQGTQLGAMGSYPPTGKSMTGEYIAIYRVRNGLILEAWVEWDNLAGLRQLGHVNR